MRQVITQKNIVYEQGEGFNLSIIEAMRVIVKRKMIANKMILSLGDVVTKRNTGRSKVTGTPTTIWDLTNIDLRSQYVVELNQHRLL